MKNSELFYLAGKCLTLDEKPEFRTEIIEKFGTTDFDWMRFIAICSNHLVLPSIFLKLKSHDIVPFLPEEVASHLKEIYELNFDRNQKILIQIQKIAEVLNPKDIFPIFLKGAGNLIDHVYADLGDRIPGDIDFLVSEKDYLTTADMLKNEGYAEVNPPTSYRVIESMKHYPRMYHPDFPAVIEVHRIPVYEAYLDELNFGKINSEMYFAPEFSGCYTLSDKHKIILNFVHSQFGNEARPYSIVSLRDLYDLHLLVKRIKFQEVLPDIVRKRSAEIYFAYGAKVFRFPKNGLPYSKLKFKIFAQKQTLLLNSRLFYNGYRHSYFLIQMIFSHYILKSVQLFYSKKVRQEIFRKVSSPVWYRNHLQWYLKSMRRK